jgi:hypothetical protein
VGVLERINDWWAENTDERCPRCDRPLSADDSICGMCQMEWLRTFPDEKPPRTQGKMLKRWAAGRWPVNPDLRGPAEEQEVSRFGPVFVVILVILAVLSIWWVVSGRV